MKMVLAIGVSLFFLAGKTFAYNFGNCHHWELEYQKGKKGFNDAILIEPSELRQIGHSFWRKGEVWGNSPAITSQKFYLACTKEENGECTHSSLIHQVTCQDNEGYNKTFYWNINPKVNMADINIKKFQRKVAKYTYDEIHQTSYNAFQLTTRTWIAGFDNTIMFALIPLSFAVDVAFFPVSMGIVIAKDIGFSVKRHRVNRQQMAEANLLATEDDELGTTELTLINQLMVGASKALKKMEN